MSGAMRRIGEYLGLLEDTGRYDDEYDSDDYSTEETAPVQQSRAPKVRESRPAAVADIAERRRPGPTGVVAGFPDHRPCTRAPTTRRAPSVRTSGTARR